MFKRPLSRLTMCVRCRNCKSSDNLLSTNLGLLSSNKFPLSLSIDRLLNKQRIHRGFLQLLAAFLFVPPVVRRKEVHLQWCSPAGGQGSQCGGPDHCLHLYIVHTNQATGACTPFHWKEALPAINATYHFSLWQEEKESHNMRESKVHQLCGHLQAKPLLSVGRKEEKHNMRESILRCCRSSAETPWLTLCSKHQRRNMKPLEELNHVRKWMIKVVGLNNLIAIRCDYQQYPTGAIWKKIGSSWNVVSRGYLLWNEEGEWNKTTRLLGLR